MIMVGRLSENGRRYQTRERRDTGCANKIPAIHKTLLMVDYQKIVDEVIADIKDSESPRSSLRVFL